jgi:nicotinamidase-related amidase
MMADFEKSQLVIIDIQEKLAAAMPKEVINKLVKRCELLVTTASEFGVPFICSEQYPKGLGPTLSSMQSFLSDAKFVEKVAFNCVDEPVFERCLVKSRPQIFIMGMEAHICVLQTA